MKILKNRINYYFEEDVYIHVIIFEFHYREFVALVTEDAEMTNIVKCYERYDMNKVEIDIPTFFGTGFAKEIFMVIYEEVGKRSIEDEQTQ